MRGGNVLFPFLATDSGGIGRGLPLFGMALCGAGAVLGCLAVSAVVARRLRLRQQKTAVEVTLTPAASDGYDPDVVKSIQCRPRGLDVLPRLSERDAHEQDGRRMSSHEQRRANKGFVTGDLCAPGDPRKRPCNHGDAKGLDTCFRHHVERERQVSGVSNGNRIFRVPCSLHWKIRK